LIIFLNAYEMVKTSYNLGRMEYIFIYIIKD